MVRGGRGRIDLLLTHLHMDHIQGLGFFEPLYERGREIHIWGPPSPTLDLRTRLARYLSPPLFPVRLRDLPCRLTLHNVPPERFEVGGLEVEAALVCHPGSTVGYRISEGTRSLAYLPDHEPALGVREFPGEPEWTSGFDLAAGADLLIHDAQYTTEEYQKRVGWGHSSIRDAIAFATVAGARRLVPFHHDPTHDDAMLDCIDSVVRTGDLSFGFVAGTEGATFEV
jgi:ribonuclease BN (tRNA processing enzyme)